MFVLALMLAFTNIGIGESCRCSFYGESWSGELTASGTVYNCDEMTFAHCTLPMGTIVLFFNKENDRWFTGRKTDTGPWDVDSLGNAEWPLREHPTRQVDLSRAMFDSLTQGNLDQGLVNLRYFVIGRDTEGLYNL